jgi:UDP-N-acetylmuramate--alanine ligase
MRSLATVLTGAGWRVSGSDACAIAPLPRIGLLSLGKTIAFGQSLPDVVVHSPAVPLSDAELRTARQFGIPVFSYPRMLGHLMRDHTGIAVAGTHGKSTVTAMTANILRAAGLDPTVVVGAESSNRNDSLSRHGTGPQMLVEACEYQSSFLHLRPQLAAILNIEPDHFDYFTSDAHREREFARFADRVQHGGTLLVNADCEAARRAATRCDARTVLFGLGNNATWKGRILDNVRGCYRFEIVVGQQSLTAIRLPVAGRHNMLNAVAAAVLAHHAGASTEAIRQGLESFPGLARRLETLGVTGGVTFIDDYAHHPTEIAATLSAVRELHARARVCAVFEPHQASRTKSLLDELALSLQNADTLAIAEIFRARELAWQPGEITAADLAARAAHFGTKVTPIHALAQLEPWLIEQFSRGAFAPGDVIVFLGAGRIGTLAHGVYQRIRKDFA